MIEAKRIHCIVKIKLFAGAFMICISINSYAQQQFTYVAFKPNNSCNGNCTQPDVYTLNNNPAVIIFIGNANT